jgi:hypothetical protein
MKAVSLVSALKDDSILVSSGYVGIGRIPGLRYSSSWGLNFSGALLTAVYTRLIAGS